MMYRLVIDGGIPETTHLPWVSCRWVSSTLGERCSGMIGRREEVGHGKRLFLPWLLGGVWLRLPKQWAGKGGE